MKEKYYTVAEVAEMFRVSRRTVYNWVQYGYLRAVKVGGDESKSVIRIPESALREFIEKFQTLPPEE